MTDQYGANCRLHPGAMFKPSDGCPTCAVGGDPYVLDANGFIPEARTSKKCCFRDCDELPVANVEWGPICETHSYRLGHETKAPHPMEKLTALEASVYGALKWLLSHDPLNSIHARDILLSAIGQSQEEFSHRYRDHIIQPPDSSVKSVCEPALTISKAPQS